MNCPLESGIGEVAMHGPTAPQRAPAPNLASFARALRQRGLLARFDALPAIAEGWNDTPELWITVNATYEAHLRRVGMEQVFATLRRDGADDT